MSNGVLPPKPPSLTHTLHQAQSSVLCLAADDLHIFSGTQENNVYVWDRKTLQRETVLKGHTGSVLALVLAEEKKWLFSSAADSTVRIWSTTTLTPVYLLLPVLDVYSGDIFTLAWNASQCTLYFGCQDTSIQYYNFNNCKPQCASSTPPKQYHKFFDSSPRFAHAARLEEGGVESVKVPEIVREEDWQVLQVPRGNIVPAAHYGYVYSMALVEPREGGMMLLTGSGDEDVKMWDCTPTGLILRTTLNGASGGVLSLAVREDTVYGGCQSGFIKVWDLETGAVIRTITAQENEDVLALTLLGTDLYAASANGQIQRWNGSFEQTASWHAHEGSVLSALIVAPRAEVIHDNRSQYQLVTGANDATMKLWDIEKPPELKQSPSSSSICRTGPDPRADDLVAALTDFVAYPSVSIEAHREDCRQTALFLKRILTQLGADAHVLPGSPGRNPIVSAVFKGTPKGTTLKPRILFYGHYDVIAAPPYGWDSPPFSLTGRNGYLYGRGVTDDKGPIMAAAMGISKLLAKRSLHADVIMLIEGEEEAGSEGFKDMVQKNKDQIGPIDAILVSNSYWIGEDTPCLTYGLRGVIHAALEIGNDQPDLHSGVDGGAVREPMVDMVQLLSTLSAGPSVLIPGFYENVRPATKAELDAFDTLSDITGKPASNLRARWREPSLSIHSLGGSGPGNSTTIPHSVRAKVSVRIVPDQELEEIAQGLVNHLQSSFKALNSTNKLKITVDRKADWWLGKLDDRFFLALESAIEQEWGVRPLRIREGGSIPSLPFLEKEFGCHALHLPMGQSSDQAHLRNERISLKNLRKGQDVVARFLLNLSS
ncbi:glutathione degradosome [Dacryopinax primogenitus]|uniref:Glutathione degradosome n=1 Tax=Dacryopinax primogenitus (strain DJM 731) TaxID=1858805 RepID=M5FYU0_DACPD|nr:glutathione degradosome [Dacryopinax primogenitus]EJU03191.1 glutathione degradosome [Dacryopinax primogenitus]